MANCIIFITVGRLCLWAQIYPEENPNDFPDIQSYRERLHLTCDRGEAGVFQWTPTEDTPDIVYYQVGQNNIGLAPLEAGESLQNYSR